MRTLILTEKPSVAEDFARALGCKRREGYFENGEYIITWAFGHLFEISDDSLPKRWELEGLPIFPERFEYKLRSSQAGKQFKVISYPTSDAEYLSESSIPLFKEVLKRLKREYLVEKVGKVGKLVFDDRKLTDHHAIISSRDEEED
jgi:DNA topoisomerase IA